MILDYEVNYLKLVSTISNGCEMDINETGTRLLYKPGICCCFPFMDVGFINGGKYQFHCNVERGIGYYIMGILPLILFGKIPTKIVFTVSAIGCKSHAGSDQQQSRYQCGHYPHCHASAPRQVGCDRGMLAANQEAWSRAAGRSPLHCQS